MGAAVDDDLAAIQLARRHARSGAGAADPAPSGGRARTLTAEQRARLKRHSFAWTKSLNITDEDFSHSDLVYGSAMISGPLKSGEPEGPATITDEAAIAGAGALRAMAIFGQAQLDIDHFDQALPEEYAKKYGDGIADPYPPGIILDAQAVHIRVPPTDREAVSVEFLAAVPNRHVYKMIANHKFVGCSVVDAIRSVSCPGCNAKKEGKSNDDKECMCQYEGSAYIANTLALEAVPNSNGTWVDVFDRATYDAIGESDAAEKDSAEKDAVRPNVRKQLDRIRHTFDVFYGIAGKNPVATTKNHASLADYMTDGIWNEEKASVEAYLTERGVSEDVIGPMSEYLFENPTALNQYQLEDLSIEDLAAWWNTVVATQRVEGRLHTLERRVAALFKIKPLAKSLKVIHDAPFGLSEVNYGARGPEAQCVGCRWYTSYTDGDPAEGTAPAGRCTITSADVGGDNGCDAFAAFPGTEGAGEPEPEPEEPEEPDDSEPPDSEEPGGDEDMPPDDEEDMAKDKDEKDKGKKGGQKEPVPQMDGPQHHRYPRTFPQPIGRGKKAVRHDVLVEENPDIVAKLQHESIDADINNLRVEIAAIEGQLARMPQMRGGRAIAELRARYAAAKDELARMLELKKTS